MIDLSIPKNDVHASFLAVASLVFFCPLLVVPFSADAAALSKPPNNLGLVGYWSFNEGSGNVATDFSGNGNHGTLEGDPQWVSGKLGGALKFDGADDRVDVDNVPALQNLGDGNFTKMFWLSPDDLAGTDSNQASLIENTNGSTGIRVALRAGKIGISDWLFPNFVDSSTAVTLNTWHHVAVVRDGGNVIFYIDGVKDVTRDAPSFSSHNDPLFRIGHQHPNSNANEYDGDLDEVRIYSRALTASEVKALHESGQVRIGGTQTAVTDGLVGHWTFDGPDVTATQAFDVSGNDNTGTITGATPAIGKLGQALYLDSALDARIQVSDDAVLKPPHVSFGGWFNRHNFRSNLLLKYKSSTGYALSSLTLDGVCSFNFLCAVVHVDGTAYRAQYALANLSMHTWQHFVGTYDGSTLRLYVDGVEVASNSDPEGDIEYSGDSGALCMGAANSGGAGCLLGNHDGLMDDIRVYNRALTAGEVRQIYNEGEGTKKNASSKTLTQGTSLASGLVGHWTFDGPDLVDNVADVSGNGNHGNFVNFPATSSAVAIGKLGQALEFNSRHIRIGTANWSGTTGTFSFWAYPTTNPTGTNNYVLCHNTLGAGGGCGSGNRIYGRLSDGTFRLGLGSTGNINTDLTFSINQWVHFTVTYNSGSWVAYKNGGQTIASGSYSGTPTIQTSAFIGADPTAGGSTHFSGIIDDVRVYNRVLSEAEVKQLYRMGW